MPSSNSTIHRISSVALLVIVLLAFAIQPQQTYAESERLFTSSGQLLATDSLKSDSVAQQEFVMVNDRLEGSFVADFFGQEIEFKTQLESSDEFGREFFTGITTGEAETNVRLIREGGKVSGIFRLKSGAFRLKPTSIDGTGVLEEVKNLNLPEEHIYLSRDEVSKRSAKIPTVIIQNSPDNGNRLDLLVFYTDSAINDDADIVNSIRLAVGSMNDALFYSRVDLTVNLVGIQYLSFPETGTNGGDLDRFANPTDGYVDWIHGERDRVGADVVVLVQGPDLERKYCGNGYLMQSDHYLSADSSWMGFSIVNGGSCLSYFSLAHELGHNLGAHHNREVATEPGVFNYSYGYQAYRGNDCIFITIMAYAPEGGCPRIGHFSNPRVMYDGLQTGTISANNANTIEQTKMIATRWRQGNPTTFSGSISVTTPSEILIDGNKVVIEGTMQGSQMITSITVLLDGREFRARIIDDSHWKLEAEVQINGTHDFQVVASITRTPISDSKMIRIIPRLSRVQGNLSYSINDADGNTLVYPASNAVIQTKWGQIQTELDGNFNFMTSDEDQTFFVIPQGFPNGFCSEATFFVASPKANETTDLKYLSLGECRAFTNKVFLPLVSH